MSLKRPRPCSEPHTQASMSTSQPCLDTMLSALPGLYAVCVCKPGTFFLLLLPRWHWAGHMVLQLSLLGVVRVSYQLKVSWQMFLALLCCGGSLLACQCCLESGSVSTWEGSLHQSLGAQLPTATRRIRQMAVPAVCEFSAACPQSGPEPGVSRVCCMS